MPSPPKPSVYSPFLPNITPYALPAQAFDNIIGQYGIRLFWLKSHTCPCMYSGPIPGSPDEACLTCNGRGIYWDTPFGPFQGLITWTDFSPRPDEPGVLINEHQGLIQQGQPTLTLPSSAGAPYTDAGVYDAFVEIDAVTRYNAQLQVGVRQTVPYQQNVTIAASGAVTIYDDVSHTVVSVSGYTVSGTSVYLPASYPTNTNYIVDFTAAPTYVAVRFAGSEPHARPLGQQFEPRRFKISSLDLWIRARTPGDIPIGNVPC
ncbi:MAG: hypothetical protein KGJ90_00460 [Patescibacteria group bacterium]|nr:hypothetical protein [Patescibacteria group bacterium]